MSYSNKELADAFRIQVESKQIVQENRPYLGMSQIGHSCARHLWYYFRWAKKQVHTPRKMRIFSRGSHEEPRLIEFLRANGLKVSDAQMEFIDCEGHFRGHNDAKIEDFPELPEALLGEFKAVADKYFKKYECNGVKETNRVYWCQLQLYMYYMNLEKALFVVVNKNTEEIYFELVDLDLAAVQKLQSRALDIITSPVPMARAFDSPTYYECNWCEHKGICWSDESYDRNCRTCKYSSPEEGGTWKCALLSQTLDLKTQRIGCDSYDAVKA